jgi:hypothetical protein
VIGRSRSSRNQPVIASSPKAPTSLNHGTTPIDKHNSSVRSIRKGSADFSPNLTAQVGTMEAQRELSSEEQDSSHFKSTAPLKHRGSWTKKGTHLHKNGISRAGSSKEGSFQPELPSSELHGRSKSGVGEDGKTKRGGTGPDGPQKCVKPGLLGREEFKTLGVCSCGLDMCFRACVFVCMRIFASV